MNAHQRYVANIIHNLTPAEVAALVACPPGNRSTALGVTEIHDMVTSYATDETRVAWADLLADAAAQPRQDGWAPTWSLPISRMIFEIDVPDEAEVSSLDEARQAA